MASQTPDYALLDHTADLAVRVRGNDPKSLFENAGKALMHLMLRGKAAVSPKGFRISLSGRDLADLLVRWLGELLYLLQGENLVVIGLSVAHLSSDRLEAVVQTVPFDPEVHEILREIKAVTYHQVEAAEKGDHWEAKVILDI
ncbi:MAG: archease [Thermodesulfobacteriota bacterium]